MPQLGLERGELSQIRINLMQQADVTDLLARKRPARSSIARPSRSLPRHSGVGKGGPTPSTLLPPTKPQTIPELPRQVGPSWLALLARHPATQLPCPACAPTCSSHLCPRAVAGRVIGHLECCM